MNTFLFLAFSFVWLIFMVYAWSLSRRQQQLHAEIERLKRKLQSGERTDP
ncbi:MAG: CcmD family protein [Acidobacteriia bacterium]|nr:CcmD family protein [Terriglobia bacterium]